MAVVREHPHTVRRPGSFFHQYALTALAAALHTWSVEFKQGVALVSPQIIFASDDTVSPDVVWMSRQRLRNQGLDRAGNIRQPPELIAEILIPGTTGHWQAYESNRHLYQTSGVQEFWVVDMGRQVVDVFALETREGAVHHGELILVDTVDREHTVMRPLLPLFSLKVASLFATMSPRV